MRGIDNSPVGCSYQSKSICEQETFIKDIKEQSIICEKLIKLCNEAFIRFLNNDFKAFKRISVVVRFQDFETKFSSYTLASPSSEFKTLKFHAIRLLMKLLSRIGNPRRKKVRMIGIRIERYT